jgi:LysM repeat protein
VTRGLHHRRLPQTRRPLAVALVVVGLAAGALAGCKSKTPPADSGPGSTAAAAAAAAGGAATTVPVDTTLFEAPFYTVVAGDTIGKIATKLGVPVQKLIDANGIAKPDKIQVGQKLRVPFGAASGAAAAPTTTTG